MKHCFTSKALLPKELLIYAFTVVNKKNDIHLVDSSSKVIIEPKKSMIHKKMVGPRFYRKNLENSKELSELLSKPFEMNWRREVVHRSSVTGKRHMADAYYFSPSGRKFRSLPQVAAYLEDSNEKILSINSFTFHKARISEHSNETERYAKRRPEQNETQKFSKKSLQENSLKNKHNLPEDSNSSLTWRKTDTDDVESLKSVSGKSIVLEAKASGYQTYSEENSEDAKVGNNAAIIEENNVEDNVIQKCSNACPGQEGKIPSLHCSSCLCLFHPQCIGFTKTHFEIVQFTCKECRNKEKAQTKPLTCILGPNQTNQHSSPAVHSGQPMASSQSSWRISNSHSNSTVPSQKIVLIKTSNTNAKASAMAQAKISNSTKCFPSGLTIEKVANAVTRLGPTEPDAASISLIRVTKPGLVDVSRTGVPIVSQSPLHQNVQIILPSSLSHGVIMPCNLLNTNSNVAHSKQQPNLFTQTINETLAKVLNPSSYEMQATTSLPRISSNHNHEVHTYSKVSSNPTFPLAKTSPNAFISMGSPSSNCNTHDHAYNRHNSTFTDEDLSTSSNELPNSDECWISLLHNDHGLLQIFRYFTLSDLMRATQVCKSWKTAALHQEMWRHVVLRNMRITSWEVLAKVIQEKRTKYLDMRGMCLYSDKNRTWHEFVAVLSQLKGLTRLDFGEVPAAIVHTVANTLNHLEGLSAEWIVDSTKDAHNVTGNCRLFIAKLCQLPHLTVLRIRGVYGLYLPSPAFGLDCLESLKHLKHLSLTSFKYQTAPDFNFLKSFSCLDVLELGDCQEWSLKSYESIGQLIQLKSLRLELEGKACCEGLMSALRGLINLVRLDLIVFHIPPNLGEILAALVKLKILNIWPDTSSQAAENNYNTLQGLKNMRFVKSFTWGLVTAHLIDNSLGERFNHQANNVPFLVIDANEELAEVKISVSMLMGRLRTVLPSSKVQVMMVPNSAYSTIGCMPR